MQARNLLPASGGIDREPIDQVRLIAPSHARVQARAVTTSDYQSLACAFPGVRNALVTRQWTGNFYTLMITVQRSGGLPVDDGFSQALRTYLDVYRMIGHDIHISGAVPVPLDLQLTVGTSSGYLSSSTIDALKTALGPSTVNGVPALFSPDRAVLGKPLYISQLVTAAMAVPGLSWVQVTRFQRYNGDSQLAAGVITFNPNEMPQVQNLPGAPMFGNLDIIIGGGT
jgi:predicted phage baseplate assembly protein